MSTPLEDYALLSDLHTGPLVSRGGSIDWLCLPRFDSPAFFSALLGDADDGRWLLQVADGEVSERRYLPDTFVLETTWRSPTGVARATDFLPPSDEHANLVRRVECLEGTVTVEHDLRIRFDYARATPWIRELMHLGKPALLALAGPDALLFSGPLLQRHQPPEEGGPTAGRASRMTGKFDLAAGERLDWELTWFPSFEETPVPADPDASYQEAVKFWTDWASQLTVHPHHQPIVRRSLLVLRALTHSSTGGIVAAPTASLPESFGGSRNWDYRYVWLRDAALTIEVAIAHGLLEGASQWRDWLLRAVAGDVDDVGARPARVRDREPARL
jgi:GH15 family glucan-1,4-alpha-glucosidase